MDAVPDRNNSNSEAKSGVNHNSPSDSLNIKAGLPVIKDAQDPIISAALAEALKDSLSGRLTRLMPESDPFITNSERRALAEFRESLDLHISVDALDEIARDRDRKSYPEYAVKIGDIRRGYTESGLQMLGMEISVAEVGEDISDEAYESMRRLPAGTLPKRHFPAVPDLTLLLEPNRDRYRTKEPETLVDGGIVIIHAYLEEQERSSELKPKIKVKMDKLALKEMLEDAHWYVENEAASKQNHQFSYMRYALENALLDKISAPIKEHCLTNYGEGAFTERCVADFKNYILEKNLISIRELFATPHGGNHANGIYDAELIVVGPAITQNHFDSWLKGEPISFESGTKSLASSHVFTVALDDFGSPIIKDVQSNSKPQSNQKRSRRAA